MTRTLDDLRLLHEQCRALQAPPGADPAAVYWGVVFGMEHTPSDVVHNYDLADAPVDLEKWLDTCEAASPAQVPATGRAEALAAVREALARALADLAVPEDED